MVAVVVTVLPLMSVIVRRTVRPSRTSTAVPVIVTEGTSNWFSYPSPPSKISTVNAALGKSMSRLPSFDVVSSSKYSVGRVSKPASARVSSNVERT